MKKIIITGGNGSISQNIKKYFEQEYLIYTPSRKELDLTNLKKMKEYFDNDIIYDLLIHTAYDGSKRPKNDDYTIIYNNILMFTNLINLKNKFKKIINLSSFKSFLEPIEINSEESIFDQVPYDSYGLSKNIIDRLCHLYENIFIIRISYIISPFDYEHRFIKKFYRTLENNKTLEIDNCNFPIFFIYDFVKVIKYYIENDNLLKDINLCYNEKISFYEIASRIKKLINSKSDIIINTSINNNINNLTKINNYDLYFNNIDKNFELLINDLKKSPILDL